MFLLILPLFLLPVASATPKAIDVIQSAGHLEEHQPNFCNRTDLASENGLQKTSLGQFLGYPCSGDFFHCRWQSDGYRTYRKSCRVGLVFDTAGTQNCNYDYNVKGCAITSNPEKCGNVTDFSCPLSEKCVSLGQRCDGTYDCVLEEAMCKQNEFPCVKSEQCIPMSGRCNGIEECKDGTDEQDCDVCGPNNYFCRKAGKCILAAQRCDGRSNCPQGEDELLCKRESSQLGMTTLPSINVPLEKSIEENTISENPDSIGGTVLGQPPDDQTAAAAAGVGNGGTQFPSNSPPGTGKLVASFPRIKFNGHSDEEHTNDRVDGNLRTSTRLISGTGSLVGSPATSVDETDESTAPPISEPNAGHIGGDGVAAEPVSIPDLTGKLTNANPNPQLMHMKKYRQPADKLVNPAAVEIEPENDETETETQDTRQTAPVLHGVPCIQPAQYQRPPVVECVQPVYQPCAQLPAELPSFVGQEGRKTFAPPTTVNFFRPETTETPAAYETEPTTTQPPTDALQELSERYGTTRDDDDSSDLLKKIEQILRNESLSPRTEPQLHESAQSEVPYVPVVSGSVFPPPSGRAAATTVEPPFYRMFKTIHVTGRPHKWQPSLSTNQNLEVTTPSTFTYQRPATNSQELTSNSAPTFHSSPAL